MSISWILSYLAIKETTLSSPIISRSWINSLKCMLCSNPLDVSTTKGSRIGLQGSSNKMWQCKCYLHDNPVWHSLIKHIDLRNHFIRDHYNKKDITIGFIPAEFQIDDIFTKPLTKDRFNYLIREFGMLNKGAKT